ncbi:MAG TPA: hypothetical protein PKY25_03065 [Bacilli bacterium]|nr:hypothetical protein [Bacilli bacterium]
MISEREKIINDLNTYLIEQSNLKLNDIERIHVYKLMIDDFNKCIKEIEDTGDINYENHSDLLKRAYEKMIMQFSKNDNIIEKIRILNMMIVDSKNEIEELENVSKLNTTEASNDTNIDAEVDEVKCRLISKKYVIVENDPFENNFLQDILSVLFLECNFRSLKVEEIKVKYVLFLINAIIKNNYNLDNNVLNNINKYAIINTNIVNKFNILDLSIKEKYFNILKEYFEKKDQESKI